MRQWWDLGKKGLKSILIKHGINNKHVQETEEKKLLKEINDLTQRQTSGEGINLHDEIERKKNELSELLKHKNEGLKIRSRELYYNSWEQNTAYFYSKLKQRETKKSILELKSEDGNIHTGDNILPCVHNFYQKLY